jgi:hypothetical protein
MSEVEQALLGRYVAERDPDAFQSLVEQHAGMVFATCRRVLGNAADAEDAAPPGSAGRASEPADRRLAALRGRPGLN